MVWMVLCFAIISLDYENRITQERVLQKSTRFSFKVMVSTCVFFWIFIPILGETNQIRRIFVSQMVGEKKHELDYTPLQKTYMSNETKHIKNATWPEGCGQRNEKTRKRENQKTEKTRKRENRENQKTGTLLAVFGFSSFSPFSRFRVFAVFAFSRFPRFRGFLVFAVFAFSGPQVDLPFSRFRVFAFSCSQVLSHVQSWRFRATE